MTLNLTPRAFTLTINGVNRSGNVININLSQNELSDGGVFVTGSITLQANYNEVREFTYLASPSIGENWARGATIVYQVANDSGTLVNHILSGGALYILKEPAPPNAQYQITLEVGDQFALKNYRSADTDASQIVAGESTDRDVVITRYLNAATISNSISSIPYPFTFPQPKTEGNSLGDVAAKMARASNHILYTNSSGVVVNKAINLAASPVATYRIGEDEQLFEQVDSSGIETPVDELVISGIRTSIESISYPKTTVNIVYQIITVPVLQSSGFLAITTGTFISYRYIEKRTTTTDYGWDGAQEKVVIFVEGSSLPLGDLSTLRNLTSDPAFFIRPISETTEYTIYDNKNRLSIKRVEKDAFWQVAQLTRAGQLTVTTGAFATMRVSASDEEKIYAYDDLDVLQSIRTETQLYNIQAVSANIRLVEQFYGKTAKVEAWSANSYSIENFYKPATLQFTTGSTNSRIRFNSGLPTLLAVEGDWETSSSELVYATDGSTKPPATTYRKPYEPIEEQINAKLTARPFAGQSFYSRSRPIEVPFLESQMQATEYGNTYLALLYGRKQGFEFGTALDNTLLSLTPLSRINIIWRGVRYDCLTDGLSWSHTQTQMAIGMRLIVLGTALESDPPETVYPAIVASALIELRASQDSIGSLEISAMDFVGGRATQESFGSLFVQEGVIIEYRASQIGIASLAVSQVLSGFTATQDSIATLEVTLDTVLSWADLTAQEWADMTALEWSEMEP